MTIATPHGNDLPDVQSAPDARAVSIDRVGVSDVRHPVTITDTDGSTQSIAATFKMTVALPSNVKGTHMSRFLEVLGKHQERLGPGKMNEFMRDLRSTLGAEHAQVELVFPWFITKPAPITGGQGMLEYQVRISVEIDPSDQLEETLMVKAPATSLCPCSKEISEYGAHNQRCELSAEVTTGGPLGIAELGSEIEAAASCEVYPVLKRPDEKFVTEAAFENPKFVEDIIRDLALNMNRDDRILTYRITSENFESIHGHNAWAEIARTK
ncbi:MAG: GTP cyclohydrolase FolE2 [Planctomycetota bacterium]|nr:GTP cyclohydrolase FolE2 [Planctomycetota bacterium]